MWQSNACDHIWCLAWNDEVAACGISVTHGINENVNINMVNTTCSYSTLSTAHRRHALTCKQNHMMAFCFKVSLVNFSCSLGQLTHWIWPLIIYHFNHHFTIWQLTIYWPNGQVHVTLNVVHWQLNDDMTTIWLLNTDHIGLLTIDHMTRSEIVKWWLMWSMISGQILCVNWRNEHVKLTSRTLTQKAIIWFCLQC
jgi:hypothetical protein